MSTSSRNIRVPILTRVEGEGSLVVKVTGDQIDDVQLAIYEPPRFFEALLRGRQLEDVPDITSRICGICPIAYQMTAALALEQALGIEVSDAIGQLRRLIYYAEWIESHVLHIHLLQAPDFFGCSSGIELAKLFPDAVTRGLQLKKIGNRILEVLGGRAIHPINVAVGGFHRMPKLAQLKELLDDLRWGLQAATEATKWIATLPFPDFDVAYDFVAQSHPSLYAICDGQVRSSDGRLISAEQYEQHFAELHVSHSTALQSRRIENQGAYFVGPLARINLNFAQLSPRVQQLAAEVSFELPCINPYKGILARALEVVLAFEQSLEIIDGLTSLPNPKVKYTYRAGEGCAVTEAPRGLIYHHYEVDSAGRIVRAKIVPPTSQNQARIEADLRQLLPSLLHQPDDQVAIQCEQLVRNYDPCISCSTHFLKLRIERS